MRNNKLNKIIKLIEKVIDSINENNIDYINAKLTAILSLLKIIEISRQIFDWFINLF